MFIKFKIQSSKFTPPTAQADGGTFLKQAGQRRTGIFNHKPPNTVISGINGNHKQSQNSNDGDDIIAFAFHAIQTDIIKQEHQIDINNQTNYPDRRAIKRQGIQN